MKKSEYKTFLSQLMDDLNWSIENCSDGAHFRENLETYVDNIDIVLSESKGK